MARKKLKLKKIVLVTPPPRKRRTQKQMALGRLLAYHAANPNPIQDDGVSDKQRILEYLRRKYA